MRPKRKQKKRQKYRLPEEDENAQHEVQRSVDGEHHLVEGTRELRVVLGQVEQQTVEEDREDAHDRLGNVVHKRNV